MLQLCSGEPAQYFFFSSNPPALLYYSHFVAILVAVAFVLLLIPRVRESLAIKLYLAIVFFFMAWAIADVLLWASIRPDVILFSWSLQILLELLLYVAAFYFAYVFISQKDLPFLGKVGLLVLLAPIIGILPTSYLLPGVDISSCNVVETPLLNFSLTYGIEIFLSFFILFLSFWGIHKQVGRRTEIILFTTGLIVFLIAFSSGNIVGSITDDWDLAQVGLFGMPVFIAFLTYTVVKFKIFNIKLIATQALVWAIALLIGARLFYSTTTAGTILSAVTLVGFLISGVFLVRSVKKEIEQREELAVANKGQENLIHVMNHQIKGYLGTARNIFAELSQGDDYGQMPEASKPLLNKGLEEMAAGVEYVQQILKGASAHSGTLPYDMRSIDLKSLVVTLASKQKETVEKAGLSFESNIANGDYNITGDATMLEETFKNLITNAIKYNNPNGSVSVTLSRADGKILFSVKDTGVGISKEDAPKLFKPGGVGKDSIKHNVESSGYGLALVKPVVEKHQGKVWYTSNSPEKGTTFFIELPVVQTESPTR